MRRKLALVLSLLALFAVAGGAIGASIAFGDSGQPAQRADRSVVAQENRGARQRGDRASRPPATGNSRGSAQSLLAVIGASFSAGVGAGRPSDAWHFPRIGDHLHPTAAGHRWIAERLAAGLRAHQVAA